MIIQQREGSETIRFTLEKTLAFQGNPDDRGDAIPVEKAVIDPENQEISIHLATPTPPGKTVTIGLKAIQNPDFGGVYLFGVTAFPAGEKARGLYLGVGRFQIYQNGASW